MLLPLQAEATLVIRPYLATLSLSEFCAIMTCGYASVSGGIIGTLISLGAPSNHLVTAAVISAPAALAIAKIIMPEITKVDFSDQTSLSLKGMSR
ncbi:sodium/nucleoside cotransporter [Plakobranchus ocellatus]|uniref:Sodium/nucleoside cotransporter n=1 Tax=Plakobranchus ocellatus TaxID=259542 RepID=A0AAV3ZLK2_9GAST|nr:sodium/nucleoside cotransporter [Plakobranchus ocellatus]